MTNQYPVVGSSPRMIGFRIVMAGLDPAITRGNRERALFARVLTPQPMAGSSPAMTEYKSILARQTD
jgi:hypothetical protein